MISKLTLKGEVVKKRGSERRREASGDVRLKVQGLKIRAILVEPPETQHPIPGTLGLMLK